jgi:hypothetical protein
MKEKCISCDGKLEVHNVQIAGDNSAVFGTVLRQAGKVCDRERLTDDAACITPRNALRSNLKQLTRS